MTESFGSRPDHDLRRKPARLRRSTRRCRTARHSLAPRTGQRAHELMKSLLGRSNAVAHSRADRV